MAKQNNPNVLTEEFLMDMFGACLKNSFILAIVMQNLQTDYLPDRDFINLFRALKKYYDEYQKIPPHSILCQMVNDKRSTARLLSQISEGTNDIEQDELLKQIEDYIKRVKFQMAYKDAGDLYNKSEYEEASDKMVKYSEWLATFSLCSSEFVDVVNTFDTRFVENRRRHNASNKRSPITRFYIDELDARNNGRDLRTQLTCFMAPTGVGKSHIARWVGKCACQIDGLNVLHFQLEGSRDEVVNAYSASLVGCNSFKYETGTLRDSDFERMKELLKDTSGKLFVKAYPKFNARISTIDIRNGIHDFKKHYGIIPDVIIVDSMDLLIDSSGRKYTENGERHKRIAVANDLKDIASDEQVWLVGTYQSTIENREWLNDEKNVLTEFNTAEAKGLARPLTHLITLNQSDRERKEHTMRLYVAKSRFFEKGDPIVIATDYNNETFYDRVRTMNLNKIAL